MSGESWLAYLLIFGCAALAAHQAQAGLVGLLRDRRHARRRFAAFDTAAGASAAGPLIRRADRRSGIGRSWQRLVMQSGVTAPPAAFAAWGSGLALLGLLALPVQPFLPRLVLSLAAALLLVVLYLRLRRARRQARFGEQLPELIDVIVRSLRAGHPLPVSLGLVARETPAPAGPEFALAIDEMNYGRSIAEALEGLQDRVGHPELAFLVAAVAIAHQTGGNLGEILSRLSRLLRERMRLSRRVRALTAEGRFSGYALSALPILLFGAVNLVSPAYYAEFWQSDAARPVAALAGGLLAIGNLIIFRLVNFRV